MFKRKYILIIGGLLLFICLDVAILSITLNYVESNREWTFRQFEEQVKAGSQQLQFYFRSLRSNLLGIERYLRATDMKVDEELYGCLEFVMGYQRNAISEIIILDSNGNVIAGTNPSSARLSFRKSEYFKKIRHTASKVYLSEVIIVSDLSRGPEDMPRIIKDPLDLGFMLYTGVYSKGLFKGAVLFLLRGEPFFNRYSLAITKLTPGCGFIFQEDGRILFCRNVEFRGKFLSDLPEFCNLSKANLLLVKTEGKTPLHRIFGQHMMVASETILENRIWTTGLITTTSKLTQKTLRLIYTLSGLVLFLGITVFSLVFALIRLGQARGAIKESEERFRALFEGAPDAIFLADPESGEILDANPAASQLLLKPHEKIVGLHQSQLHLPKMEEYSKKVFCQYIRQKGQVRPVEISVLRSDGGEIPVEITAQMISMRGKPVLQGVFRDITERKKAEEELTKYREHLKELVKERTGELEKSQQTLINIVEDLNSKTDQLKNANIRLQEMDRLKSVFLAGMSHELRTPLNSIIGFTGIILMGMTGEITEEQKKQLTMVKNSANHLLSLIEDLLDISRIEAGKVKCFFAEFRLNEVIREVVETLSSAINEKRLKLVREVPEDITLFSDRRRIKQVLINLMSNAVKFTDHGSVKITTRVLKDKRLEMRIADTGIGIKPDDMNKLFEPFQQIEPSLIKANKGTGLGLHISKKLAVLLGGNISAKSEYGKGSEFTFTIPLKIQKVEYIR